MIAEDSKSSKRPGECHHNDKEWDEATGGAWIAGLPIIRGYMIKLAQNNYDHFLPHAQKAYVVGYEYAIEKAREAGKTDRNDFSFIFTIFNCILTGVALQNTKSLFHKIYKFGYVQYAKVPLKFDLSAV